MIGERKWVVVAAVVAVLLGIGIVAGGAVADTGSGQSAADVTSSETNSGLQEFAASAQEGTITIPLEDGGTKVITIPECEDGALQAAPDDEPTLDWYGECFTISGTVDQNGDWKASAEDVTFPVITENEPPGSGLADYANITMLTSNGLSGQMDLESGELTMAGDFQIEATVEGAAIGYNVCTADTTIDSSTGAGGLSVDSDAAEATGTLSDSGFAISALTGDNCDSIVGQVAGKSYGLPAENGTTFDATMNVDYEGADGDDGGDGGDEDERADDGDDSDDGSDETGDDGSENASVDFVSAVASEGHFWTFSPDEVAFMYQGAAGHEIEFTAAGASKTVTTDGSWHRAVLDVGELEYPIPVTASVSGTDEWYAATIDEAGQLVDLSRSTRFTVTNFEVPETVSVSESAEISATVTNDGDERDDRSVALLIDGESVESRSLSLDSGASETVTFDWVPETEGDVNVTVTTGDDGVTGTVSVQPKADDGEGDDDVGTSPGVGGGGRDTVDPDDILDDGDGDTQTDEEVGSDDEASGDQERESADQSQGTDTDESDDDTDADDDDDDDPATAAAGVFGSSMATAGFTITLLGLAGAVIISLGSVLGPTVLPSRFH